MQIPILNGIFADSSPNLRTSYPVNLVPTPKESGISNGYLRPADGIIEQATGPGIDRGGINWRGICYRVMGTKLVQITNTGSVIVLGDVGGTADSLVTFDYSFDRLAIASGNELYYWDGSLTKVTDPDLGKVVDVVWVDGYFMTTDGTSLIVTDLNDPFSVNPLRYGSSEVDPDPVVALLKLRDEVFALNRNTIEVFDNVGGDFFPFQRIDGAQIQKGCVGTFACAVFMETVAFLGSGRNEAPSIYLGANGQANKISSQEVDEIMLLYTEEQLAGVLVEARNDRSHQHLYVHLPDRCLVYDGAASQELGTPVWFCLTSALVGFEQYRARHHVWAYDKWLVADTQSAKVGYLNDGIGDHWGQKVRWEFGTMIVYNDSNGALFNQMELVALTGSVALDKNPQISTSFTTDGITWSQPKFISCGGFGARSKRLAWFNQGHMRNWRIQRFNGDSDAHIAFVRLEADVEALAY